MTDHNINTQVRGLFRVNICQLEVPFDKTHELVWHVALKRYSTVVEVLAAARSRFTERWRETHIIIDIVEHGKSLYEPPTD